jgi:phage shock protein PspC (stress-responsive transcriptional regulator)
MIHEQPTDRAPGRFTLLGVCYAIADRFGVNPLYVRIGTAAAAVFAFAPTVALYCLGALILRRPGR